MRPETIYKYALPGALIGMCLTLILVLGNIWFLPKGPDPQDGPPFMIRVMLSVGFTSLALTGAALITKK
jgi:hypothetical protein